MSSFPPDFFIFLHLQIMDKMQAKIERKLLPMNSIVNISIFEEAARVLNSIYLHNKAENRTYKGRRAVTMQIDQRNHNVIQFPEIKVEQKKILEVILKAVSINSMKYAT